MTETARNINDIRQIAVSARLYSSASTQQWIDTYQHVPSRSRGGRRRRSYAYRKLSAGLSGLICFEFGFNRLLQFGACVYVVSEFRN
jgi:hypothetical protein